MPLILRPGPLAQLVEQETLNLKVTGSIPVRPMYPRTGTQIVSSPPSATSTLPVRNAA